MKCQPDLNIPLSDRFLSNPHNKNVAESEMSAQIFALLEHYKQADPVGLPNAPVPDPLPVPYTKQSMGMATLTMKNSSAYGLSKFRIKSVAVDVNQLIVRNRKKLPQIFSVHLNLEFLFLFESQVKAEIQLDQMQIKGSYTLSTLFSSAKGPFTVTITNVIAKGNASVAVERDGKIRTQDISMDMSFSKLESDFQNLGFMGSIFQSIINGAPNLVFDSMKPFMLKEAYSKLRSEIDSKVTELMGEYRLPNSISPLDMAIGEARRRVREMGFDPMIVRNYNHSIGIFMMQLKNTWIKGVSSFHRVGDLLLGLDNNTVTIGKFTDHRKSRDFENKPF